MSDLHTRHLIKAEWDSKDGTFDITDDMMSFSYSNAMGSPASNINITISAKNDENGIDYLKKISTQDFIRIKGSTNGGEYTTLFNALVSRVVKTYAQGRDGVIQKAIAISCQDIGKLLIKHKIFYNPYVQAERAILAGDILKDVLNGDFSPNYIIKALLDTVFQPNDSEVVQRLRSTGNLPEIKIDLGNAKYQMKNVFEFKADDRLKGLWANIFKVFSMEGNLWNCINGFANNVWTELFLDNGHAVNEGDDTLGTDPDKTYLYLRQTPFDKERYESLITHELTWDEIKATLQISKSDVDVYNFFMAYPSLDIAISREEWLSAGVQELLDSPEYACDANRFGISKLWLGSLYIKPASKNQEQAKDAESQAKDFDKAKALTNQLKEWFQNNPEYYNSSFNIVADTDNMIKLGHRIKYVDDYDTRDTLVSYVTAYALSWSYAQPIIQNIQTKRGVYKNGLI